jgi:uncharacterized protein (DUF4415 family)
MSMPDDDPASRPDEDNPEWTAEDFAEARPALEVIGAVFGAPAAEALRRRPGRPQVGGELAGKVEGIRAVPAERHQRAAP